MSNERIDRFIRKERRVPSCDPRQVKFSTRRPDAILRSSSEILNDAVVQESPAGKIPCSRNSLQSSSPFRHSGPRSGSRIRLLPKKWPFDHYWGAERPGENHLSCA